MPSFKEFRYFIYSVTLLSQPLYWSVTSLLGQNISIHDSAGGGFVAYNVLLFFLTIFFSFRDVKIKKLHQGNKLLLGVIFFYVLSYFLESISFSDAKSEWFGKSFMFFVLFGVTGVLLGIVISQNGISRFYRYIDFLVFFIGIGYVRSIPMMIVSGEILGGYQDISYYSALSFGYLLYGFVTDRSDRFSIFKHTLTRLLSVILGILLVVCVFASGGRGGILLLVVEVAFCFFYLLGGKNLASSILFLSIFFIIIAIAANSIKNSSISDIMSIGMERGLSYFDSGKIDVTETSNRDIVYKEHLNRINENPFIGEGIFTLLGKYEWPHNFFLELLASGGVFFLFFWLFILISCLKNLKKMIKCDKSNLYLVPLLLYPSIMLLFSSSYTQSRIFWFAISLLLSERCVFPRCKKIQ